MATDREFLVADGEGYGIRFYAGPLYEAFVGGDVMTCRYLSDAAAFLRSRGIKTESAGAIAEDVVKYQKGES